MYDPILTDEEYDDALRKFTWDIAENPHAFNRWCLELRRLAEAQRMLDPMAKRWNEIAPACHVRRQPR